MTEISKELYIIHFQKIFNWFHDHVHAGSGSFRYDIIDLDKTHLKMVDIVNEPTGGLYFRIILNATYDDVEIPFLPVKNYKDLHYYFNTKSGNEVSRITGLQICYVQLDDNNIPIHGILYTYSPHDEKYHTFKLNT